MNIIPTIIPGLYVLETKTFADERGVFQKPFNAELFKENQLECDFKEFYYSVSKKNVIRGMHFQTPPFDHVKLVYVSVGRILDVVLDIRKKSSTFGKYFSIELNAEDGKYLYIPKGCAHGFLCLEENSLVNYAQTTGYSRVHDKGISYRSFGFDWGVDNLIVSDRDNGFESFQTFNSPFE